MKIIMCLLGLLWLMTPVETHEQLMLTDEEIKVVLERHNYWRADVGVNEKLEWSESMAVIAADWAKELKQKNCGFEHRPNNKYGENLFRGTAGAFDASYVVDAWGSEKEFYNYQKNKCKHGEMCGHYTQMVWKETKKVGCAKIVCDGMDIWVCNYDPPGNWVGNKPY